MFYLLYGALTVLFIFAVVWSVYALAAGSGAARCVAVIFWIVTFSFLFYAAVELDNKGPCVKYETRMLYSPAVKMMMPARVCVQRGEWVE